MEKKLLFIGFLLASVLAGCGKVKPWEKEILADENMQLNDCLIHRFERNQEVYREGAMGGSGGKSGGGCGCS